MVKRIMRSLAINEISAVDRPAQAGARALIMKRADDDGEPVLKDLYEVSCFANFLDSLAEGVRRSYEERDLEGDASEVPEALSEWIERGSEIFLDMAQEEIDELGRGYARKRYLDTQHELPVHYLSDADLDFISIGKRFFSAADRRQDAKSGAAMPDGSFPIKNKEDLRNAERLAGHAKNPSAARAHIRSRAKALGLELSESYNKGDVPMAMSDEEKATLAAVTKRAVEAEKMLDLGREVIKGQNDEIAKLKAAASPSADDIAKAAADKAIAENPILKAMAEEAAKNAELVKSLIEKDEISAFEKRAVALGLPALHGPILRKAYTGDAEAIKAHEAMIKSLGAQIDTARLFGEIGTANGGDATSAEGTLKALAAEYRKVNPKASEAKAWTEVYLAPANAELKKRYDAEEALAKRNRLSAVA